ncbi:phasin family protein [Chrysosporum bergii ANA360D]|jgi:polyhydroxyalkanoate synthesis regulator phasin|uniref:Phasin family protein n=1 Tax=Chrysosporum bergii ANA360D TaxID=617107 RepID=A0AA43GPC7_9CYAN|nr:phasin family protein [Chrysosporum bergii]MDH6059311.1 phasin family protein [Chrysosporum bergii ANA360D]
MAGFGDIVQKAFYLGLGLASYASEKAGVKLSELRLKVQKLADEMVAKGEMNSEEARRFVEEMMKQAQTPPKPSETEKQPPAQEPRRIEILEENEDTTTTPSPQSQTTPTDNVAELRQQVLKLQEELKNLQQNQ